MLDAKTPEILARVIELAIDGGLTAAKIILDRVMPIQSRAVSELEEQIAELRERLECHQFQH